MTEHMAFASRFSSPFFKTNTSRICLTYYYNVNGKTNTGFKVLVENGNDLKETKSQKGPYVIDQWNMDQIEVSVDNNSLIRVSLTNIS